MAEHADDGFLLYLLDMAILEANSRARSKGEGRVIADKVESLESDDSAPTRNLVGEFKVVR